jgi:hypothetical protein
MVDHRLLSGDGYFPGEDDSLLRRPTDELVDDPDVADNPEIDQRQPLEEPAHDTDRQRTRGAYS